MDATRRGNYESGSDYVLEYGELRFTFNERDFTERVEQAAIKLGFVPGPPEGAEREDLVNLTVNGEVTEPASPLALPPSTVALIEPPPSPFNLYRVPPIVLEVRSFRLKPVPAAAMIVVTLRLIIGSDVTCSVSSVKRCSGETVFT